MGCFGGVIPCALHLVTFYSHREEMAESCGDEKGVLDERDGVVNSGDLGLGFAGFEFVRSDGIAGHDN